jgi:hypothetical protein
MIKLSFDDNDNDFKIAHLSDFFFSRTITINFRPISARIQVIVSLSLCSVTWALGADNAPHENQLTLMRLA